MAGSAAGMGQDARGAFLSLDMARIGGGRDNNFNLIRMVAATGVLISHAYPIALGPRAPQPWAQSLDGLPLGSICVYVFFAISGYFIAQSFHNSRSTQRFLMARALRLFPALAVVLLATVAVAALFLTTAPAAVFWADAARYVLRNGTLFFVQYPLVGVFDDNPFGPAINGSLWTLNYEVLCYAGVFVAGMAGLLRRPGIVAAAVGAVVVLHCLAPMLPLHYRLYRLIELGMPFAVGVGLFVWRGRVPLDLRLVVALAVTATLLHGTPLFRTALTLALSYGVFWLGCMPSRLLQQYNRLGDYSYGMYIYAFPIQQLLAWHGVRTPEANIALALPLTLVCAVLSWVLVEKPALALKAVGKPPIAARASSRP